MVTKHFCTTYKKFKARIEGRGNFSERWIVGADSEDE